MKSILYITLFFAGVLMLSSCEKNDYPAGLPEYDHHYYAAYIPNNNTQVNVQRTQTTLVKFPVQFYSSFSRSYDAVAHYAVVTTGITNPAAVGVDFNVVDKNGNVITPVDGKYSMVFPKAERKMDTIYLKMLNNPATGVRKVEINILENKTSEFYVDIFSTACKRPVEIR